MREIPVPYLRSLLLLAVFAGLLVVAKILLLNNVANVKAPLAEQKHSTGYYVWSSHGIPAKPSSWDFVSSSAIVSLPKEKPTQEVSNSIEASSAIASVEEVTERFDEKVVDAIEDELVKSIGDIVLEDNTEDSSNHLPIYSPNHPPVHSSINTSSSFQNHLARQAELRLQSDVTYDGRYLKIGYPMGDVPQNIGVCTDVVIRSFRGLGIDLQQRVHEDMKRNFHRYPNNWQLTRPDSNIDHRRVPNLMTYFKRAGAALKVSKNPSDYKVGNIVTWDLGYGLTHIGIVSNQVSALTGNPLIVHNIGGGPELNDMLFKYRITGHYNYGENYGEKQQGTQFPNLDLAETILEDLEKHPEGFVL